MVTGTTMLDSSKEMLKRTKKQAENLNKKLPAEIDEVYNGPTTYKRFSDLFKSRKDPKKLDIDSKLIGKVGNSVLLEPKRNNRATLSFPKRYGIPEWMVASFTRPIIPINNDKLTVVLNELSLTPSITKTVCNIFRDYESEEVIGLKLKIKIFSPDGEIVEKWVLKDCKITNIEWSPIDYRDDSISQIILTISYNEFKIK